MNDVTENTRKIPIPSVRSLEDRNVTTQAHWYDVVRASVRIVSTGHFLRTATHARPTFSSSR